MALPDGSRRVEHADHCEPRPASNETPSGGIAPRETEPGVIDASGRFAQRRLDHLSTWQPSEAEFAIVRELVNKKAGRIIM